MRSRRKPTESTRQRALERDRRRVAVADLRIQGLSEHQIADRLGIQRNLVHKDLVFAREMWAREMAEAYDHHVSLAAARYDRVLGFLWHAMEQGDPEAIANFIRLEDRRAKLLGLDYSDKLAQQRATVTARQAQQIVDALASTVRDLDPETAERVMSRALERMAGPRPVDRGGSHGGRDDDYTDNPETDIVDGEIIEPDQERA